MSKNVIVQKIKNLIAEILYLDDTETIKDDSQLITELDLSSIDFVDLCFGLKKISNKNVRPEQLWPFNEMATNPDFYQNDCWTPLGWKEVCLTLGIEDITPQESVQDLYKRLTPLYIKTRLENLQ